MFKNNIIIHYADTVSLFSFSVRHTDGKSVSWVAVYFEVELSTQVRIEAGGCRCSQATFVDTTRLINQTLGMSLCSLADMRTVQYAALIHTHFSPQPGNYQDSWH